MKDLSVSLGEHFLNFIKGEITTGRYKNADEVIVKDYNCRKTGKKFQVI